MWALQKIIAIAVVAMILALISVIARADEYNPFDPYGTVYGQSDVYSGSAPYGGVYAPSAPQSPGVYQQPAERAPLYSGYGNSYRNTNKYDPAPTPWRRDSNGDGFMD